MARKKKAKGESWVSARRSEADDADDLRIFQERASEPELSIEEVLKKSGKNKR
jgi:hypothetical protein